MFQARLLHMFSQGLINHWPNRAIVWGSGSQTVVRVPLVVREQPSCHIRKALLIRFCVIIHSCVMLILLICLFAILILSTLE